MSLPPPESAVACFNLEPAVMSVHMQEGLWRRDTFTAVTLHTLVNSPHCWSPVPHGLAVPV
jgi:hypothetical protein